MDLIVFSYDKNDKINSIATFGYSNEDLSSDIEDEIYQQVMKDYAQKNNLRVDGHFLINEKNEPVKCFFLLRNDWWEEVVGDFGELLDRNNLSPEKTALVEKVYCYAMKFID